MGMFDDVVVNAKAAASAFSKKAGNIYDISKLKFNASSIKGEIHKKYSELGELVYDKDSGKEVADQVIRAKLDDITALKSDLAAVNELLAAAKNLMICPVCSAVIANDSAFCNKCGAKITKEEQEQQEEKASEEPDSQPEETPSESTEA